MTWVAMSNLIAVGQTVGAFLVSRLSRSLKVIRTDTDRWVPTGGP